MLVCISKTCRPSIAPESRQWRYGYYQRYMKKISLSKSRKVAAQEMLPEYNFDYSKAHPNRFAGRISEERVVVLLDPEVSQIFTTPEAVNTVLRALVAALPEGTKRKARLK